MTDGTATQTPGPPALEGTRPGPEAPGEVVASAATGPWAILAVLTVMLLAIGWQFITDASRAVPAFDTAYYQWRVEYLLDNDPGALIELRGAIGALAGGYRIAEPVTGALLRTVAGVAPNVPTIVLSILFRVLAAAGMAAFAWKHRRSPLLFYLTLLTIPALFLLQRFFGYMDNFMTAALLAGVLVLMDRMHESWGARIAVTTFLFLAGLSHPTTLAIFLLAMGAVAGYRVIRDRSLMPMLRSEGPVIVTGTVAVILTGAFWLGGLWGPTSSFSDAAVPPPASVQYFVDRSVGVLENLQPFDQATASTAVVLVGVAVLGALMLAGLVHLVRRIWTGREYFAEVTVAWTLPLLGMLGFLIGAAYPYFRFFNATLAPLLLVALGLTLVIAGGRRLGGRGLGAVAAVAVTALLAGWWFRGLVAWNESSTWLTPEVRVQTDAASAYLEAEPDGRRALFVVDAQGEAQVPYGAYKEYANAIYAGLDGERIPDATLYFGTIEDLRAGRATTTGDEVYDDIARETAREALPVLDREAGNLVVFMPEVFNDPSPNLDFLSWCGDCVEIGDSGLFVLPEEAGTPLSDASLGAAEDAARVAATFAADPPGPFEDLGGTLLSLLRLAVLLLVPGFLYYRRFDRRSWPEGVALVPLFSIASVTAVGVILVAVVRGPFTPVMGWVSWAVAVALAFVRLPSGLRRRRDAAVAAPARIVDDASLLFRKRDFTFLMGAQWLAQMGDGLVATALAKLITFGGAAGLDPEAARTPREALFIVLLVFLPYTLVSPFLGVLIDRANRRRLLTGANALRAVVLTAIVVVGIGRLGDPALYVSFLLVLAGTRLMLAIKGASLPAVLGERDLLQGNSISQAGSAVFQVFGAGVALVASTALSTAPILIAGIAVYALATLSALRTGHLGYATRTASFGEEIGRIFRDMLEGFREVGRHAAAGLALTSFLVIRTLLTFTVLGTALISRELFVEEGPVIAVAGAVGALGAVVGFLAAGLLRRRVRPVRIVTGALILGGAGMLAFGGFIDLVGISLMAFIVGISFFLGKVGVDTMMQEALADQFRGRGFSLQDVAYNFSWIIPAFVLFLFLTPSAARGLMIAAGAVFLVLAGLITLWARRVRPDAPQAAPASA